MISLYSEIRPYTSYYLPVTKHHKLYIEESGNPQGLPVLVIHDGPGRGSDAHLRQFFDPNVYRIILFDQRGAGRSQPYADISHNNTSALINDIEKIRQHAKIPCWLLFGGGWGSTLALHYAQTHAKRVAGLIIFNVCLYRKQDIEWLEHKGLSQFFCDQWQKFINFLPEADRKHPFEGYYKQLSSGNELARMAAAKSWNRWWKSCTERKEPKKYRQKHSAERDHLALAPARIACHYFVNQGFLKDTPILKDTSTLATVPIHIVHNRHNLLYPMTQAWELHQKLPKSEITIINSHGTSELEPEMIDALIHATQSMSNQHG